MDAPREYPTVVLPLPEAYIAALDARVETTPSGLKARVKADRPTAAHLIDAGLGAFALYLILK